MMTRRLWHAGLFVLALLLAFVLLLWIHPECFILKHTGYYCAGCGVQRMLMALFRGDIAGAAAQNIFMLILLPCAGIYLAAELLRYIFGKRAYYRTKAFIAVLAAVLVLAAVFTVLRNLPEFAWLAPKAIY